MNSWYKQASEEKILYVVRGISGSGKSTLSNKIVGEHGQSFSTDDYFMQDGQYMFDPSKLSAAHQWNLDRAIKAMESGISPIIVDNTITQGWEAKRYVQAAIENGYEVKIMEPDTPWKFDAEELAKRNTHGVPKQSIQKMIDRWEPDLTVEQILNSKSPYDKE